MDKRKKASELHNMIMCNDISIKKLQEESKIMARELYDLVLLSED